MNQIGDTFLLKFFALLILFYQITLMHVTILTTNTLPPPIVENYNVTQITCPLYKIKGSTKWPMPPHYVDVCSTPSCILFPEEAPPGYPYHECYHTTHAALDKMLAFQSNQRLTCNTTQPPCCSHILALMLKDLNKLLSEQRINFTVSAGTVLGAFRNNSIIPFTPDLDIILPYKEYKSEFMNETFLHKMHTTGYSFLFERGYGNLSKICINDNFFNSFFDFYPRRIGLENSGYCDIYPYVPVSRNWIEIYYHPCHVHKTWLLPYKPLKIGDDFYPGPAEPMQLLTFFYGDTFYVEQPRFVGENLANVSRCDPSNWRRRIEAIKKKFNTEELGAPLVFE